MSAPRAGPRAAFVVAGPASGVGKTTVALGLMAAFRRRGLVVQPFKCGPDFIDPGHHTRACGRASRNLDGWMLTPDTNQALLAEHARDADVVVVEGVMGLFDGVRGSDEGSTAAMAKQLGLPVLLVVDASKMAASAAALVRGFQTFDPAVRLACVVFDRVGSEGHYELLREALAKSACPPAVGYLSPDPAFQIPERHLGLHTAGEEVWSDVAIEGLAASVAQHIDLDRIFELASVSADQVRHGPSTVPVSPLAHPAHPASKVPIAVARDRAFCFYYEDNLDALRAAGAEIIPFSPLDDPELPEGVDALYLGGGYPELYAARLSANQSMRAAIARFARAGGPIYAECGGLMYLGRQLRLTDGSVEPMAGVIPLSTRMTDRLVRFGYADVFVTADCLIGPAGTTARGHSFHYSSIEHGIQDCDPEAAGSSPLACAYQVRSTLSGAEAPEGYTAGGVLASYIHLHFLSNQAIAPNLVQAARITRARV